MSAVGAHLTGCKLQNWARPSILGAIWRLQCVQETEHVWRQRPGTTWGRHSPAHATPCAQVRGQRWQGQWRHLEQGEAAKAAGPPVGSSQCPRDVGRASAAACPPTGPGSPHANDPGSRRTHPERRSPQGRRPGGQGVLRQSCTGVLFVQPPVEVWPCVLQAASICRWPEGGLPNTDSSSGRSMMRAAAPRRDSKENE